MLPLLRIVGAQSHCGAGLVFVKGRFREVYGARHLVTATLDSGQIGGGIFFFLEYPSGAPQAIFF